MTIILGWFSAHETAIISGLSVIAVATICTMPSLYPKNFQEFWTWMRDALQTAVPAARHRDTPPPTPTPQEKQP